ncbi:VOC family protein [Vibrio kanaloae]|uniref:VOC family protein n=1 Tax=Vibrio kanaloae TaxID=170673 RepID=UPI0020A5CEA7|nr:VOC family protein [Vibrio kanaloae]
MIDHVTISVSDLERSRKFYEEAFSPLGYKIAFGEKGNFWAFDLGKGFLFEICSAKTTDVLTSFHIAFRVASQQKVREFYDSAILRERETMGLQDRDLTIPRTIMLASSMIQMVII